MSAIESQKYFSLIKSFVRKQLVLYFLLFALKPRQATFTYIILRITLTDVYVQCSLFSLTSTIDIWLWSYIRYFLINAKGLRETHVFVLQESSWHTSWVNFGITRPYLVLWTPLTCNSRKVVQRFFSFCMFSGPTRDVLPRFTTWLWGVHVGYLHHC